MSTQSDKARWKSWADALRQEMMVGLTPETTKTVEAIAEETGTTRAMKSLHSSTFWRSCQSGARANDSLTAAGFEIEFEPDEDKKVNEVTLKLNATWLTILQKNLDRRGKSSTT